MELIFEHLDKNKHDRENFDCGVEVLNDFLKTRANKEMKQSLNATFVAVIASESGAQRKPIAGYYTLSMSALVYSSIEKEQTRHVPPSYPIPTARIGRLARDTRYAGIGSELLRDALYRVMHMATNIGMFGVQVDAKDDNAKAFYRKFGFVELNDEPYSLFLPLKTIIKSIND